MAHLLLDWNTTSVSWGARLLAGVVGPILVSVSVAAPARADAPRRAGEDARSQIPGFRMEGDPAIEMVFGDTDSYRKHVDRFYALLNQMRDVRGTFTHYVRSTMSTLAAHRQRCPVDAISPPYVQAYEAGKRFRELGAEMEGHHAAISALHELGETAGLTPDYRWRVRRAEGLYSESLRDYREMRSVFDQQLGGEIAFHRCDADRLLTEGARLVAAQVAIEELARPAEAKQVDRIVPAPAAATFFVDNRTCTGAVDVYVDGVRVGHVGSRAKAAFQAQPGRHSMCLIASGADLACGDPGTLRQVYVHDGWAMTLRCE